jgi:cysteine desulfurase/selenocysteine lyase
VALDYLEAAGLEEVGAWEAELLAYSLDTVEMVSGVRVFGSPKDRVGVLSFTVEGVHPHDVSAVLDDDGIAVRAGHHCAQPLMDCFGVPATVRASFSFYNTLEEVDRLGRALERVRKVFA